jgi:hypothetical protein
MDIAKIPCCGGLNRPRTTWYVMHATELTRDRRGALVCIQCATSDARTFDITAVVPYPTLDAVARSCCVSKPRPRRLLTFPPSPSPGNIAFETFSIVALSASVADQAFEPQHEVRLIGRARVPPEGAISRRPIRVIGV